MQACVSFGPVIGHGRQLELRCLSGHELEGWHTALSPAPPTSHEACDTMVPSAIILSWLAPGPPPTIVCSFSNSEGVWAMLGSNHVS